MVSDQDTGVIIDTGGIRFEAPGGQKFYVNYRGSSNEQSTSLTSKGRQALGTTFKWGGAPDYGTTNEQGTSLGIIATEDNTTGVIEIIIPAGLRGRYVRLQQSGQSGSILPINIGELQIFAPETCDLDTDTIPDVYDLDSDDDGCSDSIEAYNDANADGGDGDEAYGTGSPPPTNGNGTVTTAAYPTPADNDSNTVYDFQEAGAAPLINTDPTNQKVFIGNDGTFDLSDSDTDEYQWEVSTDGGTNFNVISDGSEYTGTQTNTLTILAPDLSKNGYIYRAILLNDTYVCGQTISNEVTLTVGPKTVITNRRITIRVKKN